MTLTTLKLGGAIICRLLRLLMNKENDSKTGGTAELHGKNRYEAREKAVEMLKAQQALVKITEHEA